MLCTGMCVFVTVCNVAASNSYHYAVDGLLTKLQIDTSKYNTHSFQANIPDSLIQLMGRWKSNAYLTYVKISPMELAKLSKT